jgi:hypothetical protein
LFRDWCGPIILREVKAIREVHKYNYCLDRWILEKLTYLPRENKILADEIIAVKDGAYSGSVMNGTYEPLFVFWDQNYAPIPVSWSLVERILWNLENYRPERKTAAMLEAEEREVIEEEAKELEDEIGENQRSELFAFEAAEFLDSTKQVMWEKNDGSSLKKGRRLDGGIDPSLRGQGNQTGTDSARVQDAASQKR